MVVKLTHDIIEEKNRKFTCYFFYQSNLSLIKKVTGEFPILLLDDVMSELDNHRQLKLLESIDEEVQTFMTTTSLDHLSKLPPDLKTFLVKNGIICEKQVD